MDKEYCLVFILVCISFSFLSSSYYSISPKTPLCGQQCKLTISLYQLGIFNIDNSNSFVKSLNQSINVISYKFYKRNNKYFIRINLQIFLSGKVKLSDLVLFDGYNFYNLESVLIMVNSSVNEKYILPIATKLKFYLLFRILLLYIVFMIFSFLLYYSFIKIKSYIKTYLRKKRELIFILKNFKIILQLEKDIKKNSNSIFGYKKVIIQFDYIVNKLLNSNFFSNLNQDEIEELKTNIQLLSFFSYDNPENIYKIKDIKLNKIIEKVILRIRKIIESKYGINKI